jgi:hypothetical protein
MNPERQMPTKDFSFALIEQKAESGTIKVEGPGAPEIMALLERTVVEHMKEAVASGREIIDFLTTFNDGRSSVENAEQIQDSTGGWLLKLDVLYSISSFGAISWADETQPFAEALRGWRRAKTRSDPRTFGPRYPYMYSGDLIRMFGPFDPNGVGQLISRADAARMEEQLAKALRVERHELSEMLADYYLNNENELLEVAVTRIRALPT